MKTLHPGKLEILGKMTKNDKITVCSNMRTLLLATALIQKMKLEK